MKADHRQLLLSLAGNIRIAMSVERGLLDLRTCLDVADALEALVFSDDTRSAPGPHPASAGTVFSEQAEEDDLSDLSQSTELRVERLREIFKLRTAKEYQCLILFLESQGRYMSIEEISSHLQSTHNSSKVYMSHVRSCLSIIGIVNCIRNNRMKGYYMPEFIAYKIRKYIGRYC